MERRYVLRAIVFFLVPTTCAIIFTVLAGLIITYITSVFMNTVLPTTPLLLGVCATAIVIFTVAMVLFTCAMYVIVIWGAINEVRARIRYHRVLQEHRKLDLEKHRHDVTSRSRRHITTVLNPNVASQHTRQQRLDC